jgi:DNA-binding CsgD family transcriptional regulator
VGHHDDGTRGAGALAAAVLRRRTLRNPEAVRILAGHYDTPGDAETGEQSSAVGAIPLSPAEHEALVSAALGESAQVAARRLYKSPWTIRTQRNQVITKLNATNIAHAVFIAAKRGLI